MRRKRPRIPLVEPDLPITPMLDMSFQLMAFFLLMWLMEATTEEQKSTRCHGVSADHRLQRLGRVAQLAADIR